MNALELFSLKGKWAVVTGVAAPKGLGMAICKAFGDAGCSLIISDITERVFSAAETLRELGYRVEALVADTSTYEGAEKVLAHAKKYCDKIDVLFNNAACGYTGPIEEMPYEDWQKVIRTNLDGYYIMSQVIGGDMRKTGGGNIVNMCSKSGFMPDTPNKQTAYNVSKSAIKMLTQSLAAEWAPYGIRVNGIAPGNMITQPVEDGLWDHCVDAWKSRTMLNRFGYPQELAGAALLLASEASSFMTGTIIHVDGGYTAW